MELINEVPPIKVDARVVACEGGTHDCRNPQVCLIEFLGYHVRTDSDCVVLLSFRYSRLRIARFKDGRRDDLTRVMCVWNAGTDPALGHPIEYISLDGTSPAVCKYCGLRYYQGDAHGHH